MSSGASGILRRMPWHRYSFLGRESVNDGVVPKELKRVFLKESSHYNSSDVSKLLTLVGKCSCDPALVYNTNWREIYEIIYSSLTKAPTHLWSLTSLVKLLQNASYLSNTFIKRGENVDFLGDSIKFMSKRLGKNISDVSSTDICKIIYSCSKGDFLELSFVPNSFLSLLENEVIQRITLLEPVDLLKILHSISSLRRSGEIVIFGRDFALCICNKILEKISKIGSIDIANLVCYLHHFDFFNSKNKSVINRAIHKRLYGLTHIETILTVSLSLCMFRIIDLRNLELIVSILHSLEEQLQFEDVILSKLLIYYLKYNNNSVYEQLTPRDKGFLNKVEARFPNEVDFNVFNLSNMRSYRAIHKVLKRINHNFVPFIHGPYLVPFYDPVNRLIIEPPLVAPSLPPSNATSNYSTHSGQINPSSSSESESLKTPTSFSSDTASINSKLNWISTNLDYYNSNRLSHLRAEGLKVVQLPPEFLESSVYSQLSQLTQLLDSHSPTGHTQF